MVDLAYVFEKVKVIHIIHTIAVMHNRVTDSRLGPPRPVNRG